MSRITDEESGVLWCCCLLVTDYQLHVTAGYFIVDDFLTYYMYLKKSIIFPIKKKSICCGFVTDTGACSCSLFCWRLKLVKVLQLWRTWMDLLVGAFFVSSSCWPLAGCLFSGEPASRHQQPQTVDVGGYFTLQLNNVICMHSSGNTDIFCSGDFGIRVAACACDLCTLASKVSSDHTVDVLMLTCYI